MSLTLTTIRVAVVEDRACDRQALVQLLESTSGFSIVAACRSATEALLVLPGCKPDVILMDIQLPGLSGIDGVGQLRPLMRQTQFMMLTVFEDHDLIFRSLAAGAT